MLPFGISLAVKDEERCKLFPTAITFVASKTGSYCFLEFLLATIAQQLDAGVLAMLVVKVKRVREQYHQAHECH